MTKSVVTFSGCVLPFPTFLGLFCLVILMLPLLSPCFSHPFLVLFDLFFSRSFPVPHWDVSAAFHHPLTADEMTVGKVYAALMIFDFYKQNKNSREQVQPPGGLCQVLSQKTFLGPPSCTTSSPAPGSSHQSHISSRKPGCFSRQDLEMLSKNGNLS